ncbi:MAG TPA: galactokinase [Actinomycetota bacterium]|jgi:galactokinase|nr:galactokinase [Actinomycetota bacterium]
MSDRVARVAAAFRERAGRDPDGVWAAPGRVNLIGEHTDYNDGFVLPAAIDRLVLAAAGRRDDGRLRLWSLQSEPPADLELAEVGPGKVDGWAAYPAGVAWALGQAGVEVGGADLLVDGDVPAGAGLSSSAALECATAIALADLEGAGLDRVALAGLARRAENEVVGVPSGAMDQMVSMLGRAGHALFLDTRSLETEQVPLPLEAAGLRLVVIDTRAGHRLVDGAYADRRAACEAAAATLGVPALRDATQERVEAAADALGEEGLRRARHVVSENARVLEALRLLRAGELERLGPLLVASHASLRDDYEVSSPELDTAVEAAVDAGAVGARMTGAGFGGSALALARADLVGRIDERVRAAFAAAGFGPPAVAAVVPSDGARRLA